MEFQSSANDADSYRLACSVYTVIIADVNNCTDTVPVTITEPPALTIAFNNNSVVHTSCAHNNGSVSPTYSGGTGSLSYQLEQQPDNPSINNLAAGTYTVTVTDGNNCTLSASVVINPSTVPVLSTSARYNYMCRFYGYSYGIRCYVVCMVAGSGLNTTTGPIVDANPLTSMLYQVIGSDTLGCADTAYINLNSQPHAGNGNNSFRIYLPGRNYLFNNYRASTYSWSPPTGLDNPLAASVNANPAQTTTYTVTGDMLGCTATASVTVTVDTVPVAAFGPPYSSSCAPLSVQFY
jgi:hypothetical protein